MSPTVNRRAIARVLAGVESYDAIGEREQAIVREEWDQRATMQRSKLDYAAKFAAEGESYSELDDAGEIKVHPAA